jgi:hypothetical protein
VGGLIAQDLIMEWQVAVQWLLGAFFGAMGMMQLRKVLLK